jgi:hypothetical protein
MWQPAIEAMASMPAIPLADINLSSFMIISSTFSSMIL